MFVGHYAAALAAKGVEPRAPLWTYVVGCQLIDIGWGALVITGHERFRVDPSLPGSQLVLEHMPYTHSLPAAVLWSFGAGLVAWLILRLKSPAAVMVGLTVFSHWILDFLVHRPDLGLWFHGPKVGLGLWNHPVPEQALEIGVLAMGGAAWAWRRGMQGQGPWAPVVFLALLMTLQIYAMLSPPGASPGATGMTVIAVYLGVMVAAWFADRQKPQAQTPGYILPTLP